MAIVAERFVGRPDVVRIKYKNDDPTKEVDDPVDLFEMQACRLIHLNFELSNFGASVHESPCPNK